MMTNYMNARCLKIIPRPVPIERVPMKIIEKLSVYLWKVQCKQQKPSENVMETTTRMLGQQKYKAIVHERTWEGRNSIPPLYPCKKITKDK